MPVSCLTIDLGRCQENYHTLDKMSGEAICAAVVKSDGYGLGLDQIGMALLQAGCRHFFVAHDFEGIALRSVVNEAAIYVLNGPVTTQLTHFAEHKLIPVVNSIEQLNHWMGFCQGDEVLPLALHVDTGMNRLGLSQAECAQICCDDHLLERLRCVLLMSHLVGADRPDHPMNHIQLTRFQEIIERLPPALADVPKSLANSAGIMLGRDFCFDLVRPGIALYGANPQPMTPNLMKRVVGVEAKIIQIRHIQAGETVSYGAQFKANMPMRLATIGVGYGDGYFYGATGKAMVSINGKKCSIIGRITMDLMMVDVTDMDIGIGDRVELIGDVITVDEVAKASGTIGYEVLTNLGGRYKRRYIKSE